MIQQVTGSFLKKSENTLNGATHFSDDGVDVKNECHHRGFAMDFTSEFLLHKLVKFQELFNITNGIRNVVQLLAI